MPDTSPDPIESLYRAAQLVSESADEADLLLRRALEAGDYDHAIDLLASDLAASGHSKRPIHAELGDEPAASIGRTDAVMRAVVRRDVRRCIPDSLAVLDPTRRVRLAAAVWRTLDPHTQFESEPTPSERTVMDAFVRLVRARLPWRRTSLSDAEYRAIVLAAVREFMDENTEPVSPAMESALRSVGGGRSGEIAASESSGDSPEQFLRRSRRFAAGLLLIVLAALLGTWLSTSDFQPQEQPAPRLFEAIERQVDRQADLLLQTRDSGQAERYVRDRFGWRIVVPFIEGAALEGVESEEVVPDHVLPVLRYSQSGTAPDITVFVIPYAIIQQMRGEVIVDRTVLDQIAVEGSFDVVRTEDVVRVAWRRLDDVYVALVSSAEPGFQERISIP